jgi:hypothetical protein
MLNLADGHASLMQKTICGFVGVYFSNGLYLRKLGLLTLAGMTKPPDGLRVFQPFQACSSFSR